jgi:2-polyprenyl-3-methyl-5-hydroxy-6-metoxy-1,4-benzoquinol methylase
MTLQQLITATIPTPASILHLGCSNPDLVINLAKLGYQTTCVTPSPSTLQNLRQQAHTLGLTLTLIHSSLSEFEPKNHLYDAVISIANLGLSHLAPTDSPWGKDMALLANISEMLPPKSPFILATLSALHAIATPKIAQTLDLWHLTQPTEQPQHLNRYYTPAELTRMVNRIGLKLDKIMCFTPSSLAISPLSTEHTHLLAIGHKKSPK